VPRTLLARVAAGGFADFTGSVTSGGSGGSSGFADLTDGFAHDSARFTGRFADLASRFAYRGARFSGTFLHGGTGFGTGLLHGLTRSGFRFGRGVTGRFLDFAAANEGESAQNEATKGHQRQFVFHV
jgi:hypothetical protein